MNLCSKGFLTMNKRNETFLFELSRRNNLKLFLETIINLNNLNLLTDELILCKNIDSENCFTNIIKWISTANNKKIMVKKEYNDLLEKVLKLIFEKNKIFFNELSDMDKFNFFNYFTKIKISEKSLKDLSIDDIIKDFNIIFNSEENFNICKSILYDKELPYNLLNSFLEKHIDLIDIFIQKYNENKFCYFPELFNDFMLHILNLENYKNITHFLSKIFEILIK